MGLSFNCLLFVWLFPPYQGCVCGGGGGGQRADARGGGGGGGKNTFAKPRVKFWTLQVTAKRDSYVPRGKQGTPQEVANVAMFLASDAASFVNGTEIYADGGSSGCTYGP